MKTQSLIPSIVILALLSASVFLLVNRHRSAADMMSFGAEPQTAGNAADPAPAVAASTSTGSASREAAASPATTVVAQGDIEKRVVDKYHYLLADLTLDAATRAELILLLQQREQLASRLKDSDANAAPAINNELIALETHIAQLLGPAAVEQFEVLKESDTEQHHLSEYAGGINELAPLSDEQKREVLFAKLRHKQWYEVALREAGVYREDLSQTERDYAMAAARQALAAYKRNFLLDIQQFLDARQFELLGNYETTEFELEWQRLQREIREK